MRFELKKVPVPFLLALGCSSVNPHYDPTATSMASSATVTQSVAQAQPARPTPEAGSAQTAHPWLENGTRVYSATKPAVTSLKDALAAATAHSAAAGPAASTCDTTGPPSMKAVALPASAAPVASPYSPYRAEPIATRRSGPGSITDAVAGQAIQQTAASLPATAPEPKTSVQTPERIRITAVLQDASATAPDLNPAPR